MAELDDDGHNRGSRVEEKAALAADAVWAGISGGRTAFAEDVRGPLPVISAVRAWRFLRLAVRG